MAHQWTNEELTKFYEGVNRALKKLLRRITALDSGKVSTEDLDSLILQLSDSTTVEVSDNGIETTVSDLEGRMSTIEQTASSIVLRVADAETELGTAQSTIEQLARSITLSVSEGDQAVSISLNVNGETQTASIDMSGLVTFSDLSTEGKTTICGGNIDTTSLFAKDITVSSVSLVGSGSDIPTFSLSGSYSKLTVSSQQGQYANGVGTVNVTCADLNDLHIKTGGAIVLEAGGYLNGGTGYSDVAILGQITEASWAGKTIDVAHGGTGASTAAQARKNLGIESGSWTPSVSGCSRYSRRDGWYMKVGNVVTVGWDVYCSSTSTGSEVTISGLPYTPGDYAWGGGSCSGYSGDTGVVFSGWEATSSGYIYGRGQDSGATGTRYETDITCTGGEMLAGGTITYTI
jgi:hypothetical protein